MLIINFNSTVAQAFGRGVLKGMGAPFVLFGAFDLPQIPLIPNVVAPTATPAAALAGDWKRIEGDMVKAIGVYAKEAA